MINFTLQSTFVGIMALTLIASPVSVFAQTEAPDSTAEANEETLPESEGAETADESLEITPSVKANAFYDDYKREKLPDSNRDFNDFVVGPGYYALEIAPGESQTVMLKISNRMGDQRLFQLTTEDITSEGDTGGMGFLGDEVGPYTLKDYISVPYDSFYLDDNKRAIVPVTITIPPDAEPGGFYGSILTQIISKPESEEGTDVAPTTPLVSRIGTLFFVTTPGEIERSGSFVDFSTVPKKSVYFNGPIDMGMVFENTGSVHFNPYGVVKVTNLFGERVGEVELDPWFVMPNSIRTKELSWDREFLLGRYAVTAEINVGYEDVVETKTLVFWVFPWKFLTMVFGGLFVFFFFVRFVATRFEFKRK